MLEEKIHSRYQRPETLSDPYHDFSQSYIQELLSKKDKHFGCVDYSSLLDPNLPAGTYEEVVYFLPKAFDFLKQNKHEAFDVITSIFGFCSININSIHSDGFESLVREEIIELLNLFSQEFTIAHFDRQMCKDKGWGLDYKDYVHHSDAICQGACDLVQFETLSDLAIEFTHSLAYHNGNVTKASWFLEYSCARFNVDSPPNTPEIQSLLTDMDLLNKAYAVVYPEVQGHNHTYWRDTFLRLKLSNT